MTSELVIMTPNAVAMAADSAVTVGNSKTYTGVDKLFKLSNDPPVGIMVFNNTRFLNIPFETIIKEFKKNSNGDGNEFKTVRDFQNGFIDFFKILTTKSEFKNSFENALQNVLVELKQLSANVDNFYQTIINFEVNNNVLLNSISNALDNNQLDKCIEIASDFEKILNKSDYDEKNFY